MINRQPSPSCQRQIQLLFDRLQQNEISTQEYESQLQRIEEEEGQIQAQIEAMSTRQSIRRYELDLIEQRKQQQENQERKAREAEQRELQRQKDEKREQEERIQLEEERKREAEQRVKDEEEYQRRHFTHSMLDYRDIEVQTDLDETQRNANRNRRRSNICQIIIIVASLTATTIVNLGDIPRWTVSGLTLIVSVVSGFVLWFKFKEKGINSQQTVDAVKYQRNLYLRRIKDYKDKTDEEAYTLFAERVEDIKHERDKRQLVLEQTPDKHIASEGK